MTIIGVDLDGVVHDFDKRWRDLYAVWFGARPLESDEWNSITTDTHFASDEEFFAWFNRAGGWADMPYVPGAPGGLDALGELGQVRFITSRKAPARPDTERWLAESPWAGARLDMVATDKSRFPANLYIDDAPHHVKRLVAAGRPVVLFSQPWNDDIGETGDHVLVRRAESWGEVVKAANEILRGEK